MKHSLTRLNTLNIFIVLAGIIFLIYANGLNTPFQSDDERHIYGTPQITDLDFYTQTSNIGYRHVNGLSFALNYHLGQESPFGYHLFNILIHICTTFLVFYIARLTIEKGTPWREDAPQKIALLTALLFGLHPIQTETVTYISGRPGGLAGLFYFLSFLFFILGNVKAPTFSRPILYLLSMTVFFLAVLSKENAITLPIVIILYDLCLIKGSNWSPFNSRLGFYLCYPLLTWAAFFTSPLTFDIIQGFSKKINFTLGLIQLDILKYPLKLYLFPINLTFEYDFQNQISWASLFVSIAIVLLCIFMAFKKFYIKNSILTFCVLWFPITIAPTNSFMPRTHLFSERNLYIPYFGLSLFFAVILYLVFFKERKKNNWVGLSLVLAIGLSFSSLVVKRNQTYTSASSLWADTFEKTPKKLSVGKTLSIHYLMEEKYPEALKTLNALLKINPGLYDVHQNMGLAYKSMGDITNAEKKFKDAIQIKFNAPEAHYNLASLYGNLGKAIQASEEFDISEKLYRKHINPPPQNFYSDKARAHNQAGIDYINAKKYEEALNQFKKSVKQNPNSLEARFNLSRLLLDFKNDKQQASIHLKEALQLNPTKQQTEVLKNLLSQISN